MQSEILLGHCHQLPNRGGSGDITLIGTLPGSLVSRLHFQSGHESNYQVWLLLLSHESGQKSTSFTSLVYLSTKLKFPTATP